MEKDQNIGEVFFLLKVLKKTDISAQILFVPVVVYTESIESKMMPPVAW